MPGDTIDRRMEADEKDFASFTDYDIVINNSNF
jgi:guanylate kinase